MQAEINVNILVPDAIGPAGNVAIIEIKGAGETLNLFTRAGAGYHSADFTLLEVAQILNDAAIERDKFRPAGPAQTEDAERGIKF